MAIQQTMEVRGAIAPRAEKKNIKWKKEHWTDFNVNVQTKEKAKLEESRKNKI